MNPEPLVRSAEELQPVAVERAEGASIQVILGPQEGMPHFFLRRFTIQPGGFIPAHSHPDLEHEQFVLEGEMVLHLGDRTVTVKPGDGIYIPAGLVHRYENRGLVPVRFLCMVPRTDHYSTNWVE
ncbi:MAG: cupin domain-containing protein [Bradymonadales bacterium]|nr:cupin domain-containing protein [Bradymonadales bacterium]